jgi:predicted RND superfamily exporter protein
LYLGSGAAEWVTGTMGGMGRRPLLSTAFEVPGMVRLAGLALRRPFAVLCLYGVLTAVAVSGLFRLELRTDGAALYPAGNPVVARSLADRTTFREAEQVLLLATSREGGPRVASPEGFRFLQTLQSQLEELPGLEPRGVRSIVTLIEPPETLENLKIETFFEGWSGGEEDFPAVLARIRKLAVARGLFLADDGSAAAFYLSLDGNVDRREPIADLLRFIEARREAPFLLRLTGPAVAETVLGDEVLRDLARLIPFAVLVFAFLLWIGLRSVGGVLLPLVQVLSTLVWTLGAMGWAGVPVTLVTTILPVVLTALSMTDEVHLLERVRDRLAGPASPERVRTAAEGAFADLAAPLALSSLINAAGFLSFLTASLPPLRQFGLFASLGILLAMLFTFTLVPALVAALPPRWVEGRKPAATGGTGGGAGEFFARHARASGLAGALLVATAVPGLFLLRVQDSWVDNFAPGSPLVAAERAFNRAFWGSYRFDVVLQDEFRFFWTPEGAALLEEVHRLAEAAPHVGGVFSILPPLEAAARARGNPLPISALDPVETSKVGALTEILRIRIDLAHILTIDGGSARVRLFIRNADYVKARELEAWLRERLPAAAERAGVRMHWSGDVPVALEVVGSIVGNQLRSLGGSAVLIALMLLVALRSARLAGIVMVPVLATNLLLFAVLGYAGIPLGIASSMFAALALGAGIDFALHYLAAWRRERQGGLSHDGAVAATLRTAGRGLRWNATVLSLGFLVLSLSSIRPNATLGLLLGAAMLVSYGTTLAFLPELLRRFGGMEEEERGPRAEVSAGTGTAIIR